MNDTLILASASPRRKKILEELGLSFEIIIPGCEETRTDGDPERTVLDNAVLKNNWVSKNKPDRSILSADTIVVFDGHIIEKPKSLTQAREFLEMFSGNTQKVLTAVAVSQPGLEMQAEVAESTVHFKKLSDDLIANYFTFVDPMDKAGAYDVDQYGDLVIESHEGSYSNIMGLPKWLVKKMLAL